MLATLLSIRFCAKILPRWHITTQINRTFAFRSDHLSADATATAAAATISQRKIELKEPIGVDRLQKLFDSEVKNGDIVPVFKRALLYGNKIAIKDTSGDYSYRQIFEAARKLSTKLSAYNG